MQSITHIPINQHTPFFFQITFLSFFFYSPVIHYPERNITSIYNSFGYIDACIIDEEDEDYDASSNDIMRPCIFGIFPNTAQTHALGSHIHRKLFVEGPQPMDPRRRAPSVQYFESEEEFRVEMNKDPTLFFAAIQFSEYGDDSGHTNYTLYMNSTLLPIEYSRTAPKQFSTAFVGLSNSTLLSTSGFMAIQQAIDASMIEVSIRNSTSFSLADESEGSIPDSNNSNVEMNARLQFLPGFPAPKMELMLPVFVSCFQTISCIPFIAVCLIHLVTEYNSKTKEYLFMLGLKKSVHWGSWFITFLIPATVISIFGTILSYAFSVFSGDWFMMFLFYFIFMISCILFSFFALTFVHSSMYHHNCKYTLVYTYYFFCICIALQWP